MVADRLIAECSVLDHYVLNSSWLLDVYGSLTYLLHLCDML